MNPEILLKEVTACATKQKPRALSARFPLLKPLALPLHILSKKYNNHRKNIARTRKTLRLKYITARHSSPLLRKLGESDMRLQKQKITNLKRAIENLDGLCILPGQTFSLWEILGKPTKKKGYVDGMLLSSGQVFEGPGGGLCQLGNLLHFLFLHTPLSITERYHHSMDVFPDSSRTIPFASGATVMYNFIDLQAKNNTSHTFQLKLWLTDTQLKGHVLCDAHIIEKVHVYEKEHIFINYEDTWYRRNQLWRNILVNGETTKAEHLYTTIAPVIYPITEEYLKKNNFASWIFNK